MKGITMGNLKMNDHQSVDLIESWQIDSVKWNLIKHLLQNFDKESIDDCLMAFESVQKRYKECYNPPDRIDCILTACNEMIGGFGVESIEVSSDLFQDRYYWNSIGIYINLGDNYITTIIYNTVDQLFEIANWGDYHQSMEDRLKLDATNY
jgi:hypothetical protein